MNAERFGEKLRALREAADMTQQDLADRVGVRWESVSRWERGTREPAWSDVLKLAEALGVDCTAFQQTKKGKRKK
jgi:transcriptional regulator with XRE-family HTH domain